MHCSRETARWRGPILSECSTTFQTNTIRLPCRLSDPSRRVPGSRLFCEDVDGAQQGGDDQTTTTTTTTTTATPMPQTIPRESQLLPARGRFHTVREATEDVPSRWRCRSRRGLRLTARQSLPGRGRLVTRSRGWSSRRVVPPRFASCATAGGRGLYDDLTRRRPRDSMPRAPTTAACPTPSTSRRPPRSFSSVAGASTTRSSRSWRRDAPTQQQNSSAAAFFLCTICSATRAAAEPRKQKTLRRRSSPRRPSLRRCRLCKSSS